MQQKKFRQGPMNLPNTITNLLNPGTTTGGVNSTNAPYGNLRILLYHIKVHNETAGAVTFTLYLGATGAYAAGTVNFFGQNKVVPANAEVEWWGECPLDASNAADFLTGIASANNSLTITLEGEIGVA